MRTIFVIPTYDPEGKETWKRAVLTLEGQSVKPDKIFVVIDGEGDSRATGYKVEYREKVTIIRCIGGRNYSLRNLFLVLRIINFKDFVFEKTDIICLLDGDDWMNDIQGVEKVVSTYDLGCWLTYGSFVKTTEPERVLYGQYSEGDVFRDVDWRASHLKTFLYGLWLMIKSEDLLDKDGMFFECCGDLAIMFPMMEMAGHKRIHHIPDPIVFYDDCNQLNVHRTDLVWKQIENAEYIRSLPKYKEVELL